MQDILGRLSALRRPPLLVRAARIGAQEYRRDAHLARALGETPPTRTASALMSLLELEGMLNAARKRGVAEYSPSRHVEVLSAMMAEAQLMHTASAE